MNSIYLFIILFIKFANADNEVITIIEDSLTNNNRGKKLYCINNRECMGPLPDYVECTRINSNTWSWSCSNYEFNNIKVNNVICDWKDGKYLSSTCKLYYTLEKINYFKYFIYFILLSSVVILAFAFRNVSLLKQKYLKKLSDNGKISKMSISNTLNNLRFRQLHKINIIEDDYQNII